MKTSISYGARFAFFLFFIFLHPITSMGQKDNSMSTKYSKEEVLRLFSVGLDAYNAGDYRGCANSLMDITSWQTDPVLLPVSYFYLISSLNECNDERAIVCLEQFLDRFKKVIVPDIYKKSLEYKRQLLWKNASSLLLQVGMRTALKFPKTKAPAITYDIAQYTKNFEMQACRVGRNRQKQGEYHSLDSLFAKNYQEQLDSMFFGHFTDSASIAKNLKILELNKQLINGGIPIDKVFYSIYNYDTIRWKLSKRASLVEYCVYMDMKGNDRYAAFVINPEDEAPLVYDLCSADEIASLVAKDEKAISALYSSDKLYEKIWKPFASQVKHDTLVVCPVGNLDMVNFSAISHGKKRLEDEYYLMRGYSGHSFFQAFMREGTKATAALFGGIAYSEDQKDLAEAVAADLKIGKSHSRMDRESLDYLYFTGKEVQEAKEMLVNNGFRNVVYSGMNASEDAFKKLSHHSPALLHIATHGFFLSYDDALKRHPFFRKIDIYNESKLLRSGLLMAGSKYVWKGMETMSNGNDGILSAYEISQMDLSNTRLVVLSACQTANGFVDNIEGIQGLQYAFREAGAGSMLLNLWNVDDEISYEFMKVFYRIFVQHKDFVQAYHVALDKIAQKYKNPYLWANFILIVN